MAENKDKEMNLFDFIVLCFKALGSLIKKLCVWIAQLFRLAIQYYYVMIICLVLGLFGAWVWNKPFATHYTGSVTIRFPEGMGDPYCYCFRDEGCHVIYHRFLPEDYAELMKA